MRFFTHGKHIRSRHPDGEAYIVVIVGGLLTAGRDLVNIQVEDVVRDQFNRLNAGFFGTSRRAKIRSAWLSIRMAARLQTAIEFSVMG
jgi:hypothetical protein